MLRGTPQHRRRAPFLLSAPAWLRTRSGASALNQDCPLWTGYKSRQLMLTFLAGISLALNSLSSYLPWQLLVQSLLSPSRIPLAVLSYPSHLTPMIRGSIELMRVHRWQRCLTSHYWLGSSHSPWNKVFKLHRQSPSVVQSKQRAVGSSQDYRTDPRCLKLCRTAPVQTSQTLSHQQRGYLQQKHAHLVVPAPILSIQY